jgi:hypothetical protein
MRRRPYLIIAGLVGGSASLMCCYITCSCTLRLLCWLAAAPCRSIVSSCKGSRQRVTTLIHSRCYHCQQHLACSTNLAHSFASRTVTWTSRFLLSLQACFTTAASALAGSASWLCLAAFASTIPATIACMTAAAAATAFSDVVADSIVVELARASPGATEGALQSLCW